MLDLNGACSFKSKCSFLFCSDSFTEALLFDLKADITVIYCFLTLEQFNDGFLGMDIDSWVMKTVSPLVMVSLPWLFLLLPRQKGRDRLKILSVVYVVNTSQS